MSRLLIAAVLLSVLAFGAYGQAPVPRFAQYPAKVEKTNARAVDLSHPDARAFRTRLREAFRRGVNFAGHYIVAGWGCGTGCVSGGIIDARTGKVYWPDQLNGLSVNYTLDSYADKPVEYHPNSRLLIIRGIPGQKDPERGPELAPGDYYYEWRNNRLRRIRFVPQPREQ